MKKLILSLYIFSALASTAQTKQYYDWQWKPCDASLARFVSLTEHTDSGWVRRDFYLATKDLQMRGLYKDSVTKIKNGWFRYFYANGILSSQGNYVNDKKDGIWVSNHFNGMMRDSVMYETGRPVSINSWHSNGYAADSSVYNVDGTATHIYWFDNGALSHTGRSLKGKKEGKWQYFHKNGKLAALEEYHDDELLSRVYYDETGKPLADTTNKDRGAEFKGGAKKWKSYLSDNLQFPSGVKLVNTDIITVVVAATIDEDGNVTDVYVDIPFNPKFDDEALRVMKRSPKWIPAISHNRSIRYYIRQPISFGQYD